MESLGKHCTSLKLVLFFLARRLNPTPPFSQDYEQCFNRWYSEKFLKGDVEPACQTLFEEYKACVKVRCVPVLSWPIPDLHILAGGTEGEGDQRHD